MFTLEDRYLREDGTVYLTGIQALVRLIFDRIRHDRRDGRATAAFVSGYEGSPLAGFDLELARRKALLAELDVVHRPGLNEELAATSVMGSQLAAEVSKLRTDGVLGLWYGKSPGLDRAADALRHANLAGTHPSGGALALVGDDPAAKSSSVPSASERLLADLAIPTFCPADSQDVLDYGMHAVELSRASGVWAALKVVTDVADAASTVSVRPTWTPPHRAGPASATRYGHRPDAHLLGRNLAALEQDLHTARLPLALDYVRASGVNRITGGVNPARIGVVASGKSYLDLVQALRMLGLDEAALARSGIRLLKLGVIFPVDPAVVREFATGLTEIVVVEEKRSFVEAAVKDILYGLPGAPAVHGKTGPDGPLFSQAGDLNPDTIAAGLAGRITAHGPIDEVEAWRRRRPRERLSLPLLPRTPYFCSGCPHNTSTKVTGGALVGAGIGCHTMVVFMDAEQAGNVTGLTQMGGEGAQWIGMAPFVGDGHFVQNIGDGTFMHSGSLAVRAAVAAGVNITFKLLYNSAVAMTGGQQAVGAIPVDRLASLLLLEGVAKVIVTSDDPARLAGVLPEGVEVRDRAELQRSQEELAAVAGVTVLVHDQECAAEKRRKRRRGTAPAPPAKVLINERVCEGCGDCGAKSNCLSVQPVMTEFGRKTRIHQSSCNVDYSCLSGDCPSFITVVPGARPRRRAPAALPPDGLPEPARPAAGRDFNVRITGIGGTGIVTVAQILATAAVLDDLHVRALDQTGLAQKGGAVVSDLKITAAPVEQAAKLAAAECDLYLGCDLLVAAEQRYLQTAHPGRTASVVSTAKVPTGSMIVDPSIPFPETDGIHSAIREASDRTFYLDARGLAESLFGHDQHANILQLGTAYQFGAVPLRARSIERAIELNGIEVDRNLQAFRRGRQLVADPAGLEAATAWPAPAVTTSPLRALVKAGHGTELARLLDVRVADLIEYQDERYARTYATFVETIRALEPSGTAVTERVARNLHRLMAYKDEYEVARLSLDPRLIADLKDQFGDDARYLYRLHPPVLRALGLKRKIGVGPRILRVLRAARQVRGTLLDPFGFTRVRRTERALIGEYRESVLRAMSATPYDHAISMELAGLPEMIRGYEAIKMAGVSAYRERQSELLATLDRLVSRSST